MPYKNLEQQREYQRNWMAQRRKEWFDLNGPCADCGTQDNLELDHVDREGKISHKVWSWSKVRMEEELAKCVARCEKCHQIKTNQELSRPICKHGHDISILGRDSINRCIACRREREYPEYNKTRKIPYRVRNRLESDGEVKSLRGSLPLSSSTLC